MTDQCCLVRCASVASVRISPGPLDISEPCDWNDRSADVWAFGVLLWEMFSGQRAWAGMSYTQVMQAVGYEQRGPEWPASAPAALAVSAPQLPATPCLPLGLKLQGKLGGHGGKRYSWNFLHSSSLQPTARLAVVMPMTMLSRPTQLWLLGRSSPPADQ